MRVTVRTRVRYNRIPSIQKDIKAGEGRIVYNTARAIAAGARMRAHVVTGYMKSSITTDKVGPGHHRVYVGASYAAFEEYGTRYRPPHPFLRPAVEAERVNLRRELRSLVHR